MELRSIAFADGRLTAVQTGAGPDLLVVHSLLADRTAFDPVLPWLAARFRVTVLEKPGARLDTNVRTTFRSFTRSS